MAQNTAPATNVQDLREELSNGTEVSVCFLFDRPRSQNLVGVNHAVQIASQMSLGAVTFVEGLVVTDGGLRYVRLMINTETGDGTVEIGKLFVNTDRLVIETALAFMNEAAKGMPSLI